MDELINIAAIDALRGAEDDNLAARRIFHVRDNPFETLSDRLFVRTYRLNKQMTRDLIDIVDPFIPGPSRVSALDVSTKVLTALNFFGYGSYQFNIGQNINSAISQASVSRAIEEVVNTLNQPYIFNRFVHFPRNMAELDMTRTGFYNRHQFPGCVGCIDCTHVAIYPPYTEGEHPEHIYINRKGYHSINTQIICDAELKILNILARFPGSSHDSFIWNSSNVKPFMEHLHQDGHRSYFLLGDSGYALRRYLLTPINDAVPNTPEWRYNERHRSTRATIERCNGVLKLRFRCLLKHRVLHYSPPRVSRIINACSVLHNMCIDANLPPVDPELGDDDVDYGMFDQIGPNVNNPIREAVQEGRRQRTILLRNHFQ